MSKTNDIKVEKSTEVETKKEKQNGIPEENYLLCTFMGDNRYNNVIRSRGNKLQITKNIMYQEIVKEYFKSNPVTPAEKELYF